MSKDKHAGFTLIELIIVVIILGILAAYAIPKFVTSEKQARIATIQGIAGAFASASTLIHGLAITTGVANNTNVTAPDGTKVTLFYTYPDTSNSGILAAIQNITGGSSGVTINNAGAVSAAGNVSIYFTSQGLTNCAASYTIAAGVGVPVITAVTSGC
jgi:MSHA pilin protein MshA